MFDVKYCNCLFFVFCFSFYTFQIIFSPYLKKKLNTKQYCFSFISTTFFLLISILSNVKGVYFENFIYYFSTKTLNLSTGGLDISLSFCLNLLSLSFGLLVVLIGFTTNIYILNYFRGEADEKHFIYLINSFIISMLCLVFANNIYTLFLGWECIGLTSFFLINFWNNRRGTLKSSFKAFTFNLLSDIFFLIFLVCIFHVTGASDCDAIFYILTWQGLYNYDLFYFGFVCLILCASIKSVQIVGHLWLPDSMEAPVPASALIHSATLVSAGIFLLCKFNYIFSIFSINYILIFLGSLTAAYGGLVSAAQTDMKKLLAYSTMSHCGFLWVCASSGYFILTITYLFLHGIFKAATFYCVGSFVRAYGTQDTRWMGGASIYLPFDTILLIISALNLTGLPFSVGYLYKHFFFEMFIQGDFNFICAGFIFIGMLSSPVYFFRLIFYSSFDLYKNVKNLLNFSLLLNQNKVSKVLNLTTFNHVFSVLLLNIFGVFAYFFFYWNLKYNMLITDYIVINNIAFFTYFLQLSLLYASYYYYFYSFYVIILFLLVFVTWRKNIFYSELTFLTMYFLIFLIFLF